MGKLYQTSPLVRFHSDDLLAWNTMDGGSISEEPFTGILRLQLWQLTPEAKEAVKASMGLVLSDDPNYFVGDVRQCLWIGPKDWLFILPAEQLTDCFDALQRSLSGLGVLYALTDVSDSKIILRLEGIKIPNLLSTGSGLDFHPAVFKTGRCKHTRLAHSLVLIQKTDDMPVFNLYVDRSYAAYLWKWLENAMREFL